MGGVGKELALLLDVSLQAPNQRVHGLDQRADFDRHLAHRDGALGLDAPDSDLGRERRELAEDPLKSPANHQPTQWYGDQDRHRGFEGSGLCKLAADAHALRGLHRDVAFDEQEAAPLFSFRSRVRETGPTLTRDIDRGIGRAYPGPLGVPDLNQNIVFKVGGRGPRDCGVRARYGIEGNLAQLAVQQVVCLAEVQGIGDARADKPDQGQQERHPDQRCSAHGVHVRTWPPSTRHRERCGSAPCRSVSGANGSARREHCFRPPRPSRRDALRAEPGTGSNPDVPSGRA